MYDIAERFFSYSKKGKNWVILKPNIQKLNHKHNLQKNNIQLYALIKYTMLITYFWEILIFF